MVQLIWCRKQYFTFVIIVCIAFVVLTAIAMLFYPGGTSTNPHTEGYGFFLNFFSELGLTKGWDGQSNTVSFVLFFIAMAGAGAGMIVFFLVFPQFFWGTAWGKILSVLGSLFGTATGICFVGIAFTPINIAMDAHNTLVLWAFKLFPGAVLFYAITIFLEPHYPKRFAYVFIVLGLFLIAYVCLLTSSSSMHTPEGRLIQATGQKVIVYLSVLSILFQAWGARCPNTFEIAKYERSNSCIKSQKNRTFL